MKKLISIFVLICLTLTMVCSLSGCGKKGVESEKLEEDLNICNEVQDCFTSEYAGSARYQISECVITENELDEDKVENTIYCNVMAENGYFQVFLDVKATYHYYDKNGWVLDEVSCDLDDVKALTGPNAEQVKPIIEDFINDRRGFSYGIPYTSDSGSSGTKYYYLYSTNNDFSVVDTKLNENGKSAKINCCYESDGTKYYGYYEMLFDKTGWHFAEEDSSDQHMILTESDFNYSTSAIGTFYDSYDEDTTLVIHKIENNTITYSLHSTDSILLNNDFKQGDNLTADFNSKTGEFVGFHYDTEEDVWEFGAVELERLSLF